jgi:FkbM family methyltransferase
MIIVFPFSTRDQDLALKNATWWLELGECKQHEALVCYDQRCNPEIVEAIGAAVLQVFGKVWRLPAPADIDGWPEGANYMFRFTSAWLAAKPQYPYFLWLEPDAIPLREGWLDKLEAEYRRGGKPFMGERVDLGEQRPDVPVHMSGVGMYHNPIYTHAGEAYRAAEVAWDIAAKDQIVPKAHWTPMIQHYWKHGTFTSLDGIRPETVVFHSSKDGSLIDILRQHRYDTLFPAPELATPSIPGIKILPLSGIWVIEGDRIISSEVERHDRLDFDPLLPHILPLIRPGDTVVDVGAFIGDHTLAFSKQVGSDGVVYAFEPNPIAFKCMHHNMRTCGNVVMRNMGLTDNPGIAPLCCADGNAASAYIGEDNKIADVEMTALELAVPWRVNLIKIDVEGYELKVLKGAGNLINKCKPRMVIEINPEALERQHTTPGDIFNWLEQHGYNHDVLYRHPDTPFYDLIAEPVGATEEPAQSTSYVHDSVPPPQATAPETFVSRQSIATPKEEMMECIAFLKAYAEKSNTNKQVVAQRLFHAGLRPRSRKTNDKNNSVKARGLRPDHSPKGRTQPASKL